MFLPVVFFTVDDIGVVFGIGFFFFSSTRCCHWRQVAFFPLPSAVALPHLILPLPFRFSLRWRVQPNALGARTNAFVFFSRRLTITRIRLSLPQPHSFQYPFHAPPLVRRPFPRVSALLEFEKKPLRPT